MIKTLYLKISGRVQFVGFRKWAKKTADKIGDLSGWVRNEEDRTVTVFISGEEEKVDRMILYCNNGSLFSRIDNVEINSQIDDKYLPEIKDGKFYII